VLFADERVAAVVIRDDERGRAREGFSAAGTDSAEGSSSEPMLDGVGV
jgi:hypothetical protein